MKKLVNVSAMTRDGKEFLRRAMVMVCVCVIAFLVLVWFETLLVHKPLFKEEGLMRSR